MARLATRDERLDEVTSGLLEIPHPDVRLHREPYLPLTDSDGIRLVIINPGDWDTPITCRLIYSRLDESPGYVALSYAWGSPKTTKTVLVDGVELQVTVNLESALRHLRRQSESITIWIDAIAINQQDLDERSQQVNLMRRIYREASKVIVWLGDGVRHRITNSLHNEKPPPRTAFYGDDRDEIHVAKFIQKWSVPRPFAKYTAIDVFCFIRMFMMQKHHDHSLSRLHSSHLLRLAEALRMMLLSQWRTRMWVFQEVVVAESVVFQYSGVEAPLEMFTKAASCLQDPQFPMPRLSDVAIVLHHYTKTLNDIERWRSFLGKDPSRPRQDNTNDLLGLLRATATRKASDDRDRVFALLGLLDLGLILVPDYQRTPAEVFMSVCLANMQETQTLDVLCGDLGRKNRSDLPSWTMDWSATLPDGDEARLKLLGNYYACDGHQTNAVLGPEGLFDVIISAIHHNDGFPLEVPSWAEIIFKTLGSGRSPKTRHLTNPDIEVSSSSDTEYSNKSDTESPERSPEESSPNDTPDIYNVLSKYGNLAAFDTGCSHQAMSVVYEHPSNGHLYGLATLIGKVQSVNDAVYEPIGPETILQATMWIKHRHPDSLRSLVFEMKYKNGQFFRLEEDDLGMLSEWVMKRTVKDRTEGHQISVDAPSPWALNDAMGFDLVFKAMAARRKTFDTTGGRIGWGGPLDTQPGDNVYLLPGGRTPFVLRGDTDQDGVAVFRLVGDCYLEGLMYGKHLVRAEQSCGLQHTVLPTMFWTYCKSDLVNWFNRLTQKAGNLSRLRWTMTVVFERLWATRPILLCIDKEGVFDKWLGEVHQWAWDFRLKLPTVLEERESDICTAFRNIERMTKPSEHITIA